MLWKRAKPAVLAHGPHFLVTLSLLLIDKATISRVSGSFFEELVDMPNWETSYDTANYDQVHLHDKVI